MYFHNGTYLREFKESKGLFYGYGCFETIMGKNQKAVFLQEHLKRLRSSLEILEINFKVDFTEIINSLIFQEKIDLNEEFMIKIMISDSDEVLKVERFKHRDIPNGIKICKIDNYFQNEMGMIKSISYMGNILAKKEIVEKESFEGIFINRIGNVCEGTMSNLFFVKDNKIKTPELSLNILNGIVRQKIIEIAKENKFEIEEGIYSYENLIEADSIFITNSLMKKGLLWVNNIDGKIKNKSKIIDIIESEYMKKINII